MADNKPHIIVFPFPAQGHINPALEFSKCLASNGLKVTIILTTMVSKSAQVPSNTSINVETISDGTEDVKEQESIEGFFKRFKEKASQNLAKFIREQRETCPAKVLVYDSTMPWALNVAHREGLLGASFFTQASGVCAVYYHMYTGLIKFPYQDSEIVLPSMVPLGVNDLPCFSFLPDAENTILRQLTDQFSNLEEADWIFINTFDKLENEVLNWMTSRWPFKTVGPTFSLTYPGKEIANEKTHKINLFEQNYEESMKWLDSRETGSVVYVSFGSVASLKEEQMEELSHGLMMSNCYFLWVVRASEENKLPKNFTSMVSEKGLVVNWCPQTEVLSHRAIACFMTHCGWNSTLEALTSGVPFIAMGQWVDQTTNAKLIEDEFKVGIRVKPDENGLVSREEIEMCIKEVIRGEQGKKLKESADKWKELAKEAVDKGGSSATNVEDFVSKLFTC
ncbi:UDP-glycosyltransferase 74E2-like [Olea europaea subsp. europaea]|uniref:anthocyanidin 3-O-glucoside 5-O-glucosyltransferase n=2 Tax=Olea europaea subsp. europaea TaxID=158383 RepID=A0A8S0SWY9_OLEEU|nr:UDP-glycosyltransferase 74E2-like [Olea europaea subsp. europaea]